MDDTPDTPAGSTTTLSLSPVGNSHQLSAQAAALLSSMKIEPLSSQNSETVLILLAILQGIIENTTNGDVIELSIYRAKDLCAKFGIDEEMFESVVERFLVISKKLRSRNPLAF